MFLATVRQILTEPHTESWLSWVRASRDRLLITKHPLHGYEVIPAGLVPAAEWKIQACDFDEDEVRSFFNAFGSHWGFLTAAVTVAGGTYKFRAFIRNGRRKGWSISIERTSWQIVKNSPE